jgi:Zn finger protein HypA/HybF involved in hydrogenase expression
MQRYCDQCKNYFETWQKNAKICDKCKTENNKQRILKNLFSVPIFAR